MKKLIALLGVLVLCIVTPNFVNSKSNNITIVVDGLNINFEDAKPFKDENGRILIPIRKISEALGADVEWNNSEIVISKGDTKVEFKISSKQYKLNGITKTMDTSAKIINGRTFVPLRVVSEALNAKVSWDGATQTALINRRPMPKKVGFPLNNRVLLVDNEYYQYKDSNRPEYYGKCLYIPIKVLAEVFQGTYSFDQNKGIAILNIDDTIFEFEVFKDYAKVDGKVITMPNKVILRERINVKVPANVFEGKLKKYESIVYDSLVMVIRQKGPIDNYDNNGEPIVWSQYYPITDFKKFVNNDPQADKINKKADQIISEILIPGMTEYEKVLAVNRYVVENIEYDYTFQAKLLDPFLTKKGICGGYAFMTGFLLEKMGVECINIAGIIDDLVDDIDIALLLYYEADNPNHAWNIVKVNGKYYHLDTTWNDGMINNIETNEKLYNYFLLSDEQIEANSHKWVKNLYPECNTEYDDNVINELSNKGYSIISGKVKLANGEIADKDIFIKMTMEKDRLKNLYTSIYSFREIIIKKGTSETTFKFIPEKRYDVNSLDISFSSYKDKNYKLDITKGGNNLVATLKKLKTNNVVGKLIIPDDIKISAEIDCSIIITTINKTETGTVQNEPGIAEVTIKPGIYEYSFNVEVIQPNDNSLYKIEYRFPTIYAGETYVELPVLSEGYVDWEGNPVEKDYANDGNRHPLKNDIIVKLQKNNNYVEPKNEGNITAEQLKEIKEYLDKANAGNDVVMKKLKTLEDVRLLEKIKPDIEKENALRYITEISSIGANSYRSYDDTNTLMLCSVSLQGLKIGENNYIEIFNELNDYLQHKLGVKSQAQPKVFNDSTCTYDDSDIQTLDKKVLWTEVNEYKSIIAKYTLDGNRYELRLKGFGEGRTLVVIDSFIKK